MKHLQARAEMGVRADVLPLLMAKGPRYGTSTAIRNALTQRPRSPATLLRMLATAPRGSKANTSARPL